MLSFRFMENEYSCLMGGSHGKCKAGGPLKISLRNDHFITRDYGIALMSLLQYDMQCMEIVICASHR